MANPGEDHDSHIVASLVEVLRVQLGASVDWLDDVVFTKERQDRARDPREVIDRVGQQRLLHGFLNKLDLAGFDAAQPGEGYLLEAQGLDPGFVLDRCQNLDSLSETVGRAGRLGVVDEREELLPGAITEFVDQMFVCLVKERLGELPVHEESSDQRSPLDVVGPETSGMALGLDSPHLLFSD